MSAPSSTPPTPTRCARLDAMQAALADPAPSDRRDGRPRSPPKVAVSRTPAGEYQPAVEQALEAVRAGEVFQIQVGQRFVADDRRRPARRLPGAAHAQPVAVHVLPAHRRTSTSSAAARRRWSRCTDGARRAAPDRRHPQARRDRRARRRAGRRTGRRSEGAGRARHARRPGAQRPRPGVRARAASRWSSSARSSGTATSGTSSPPSRRQVADGQGRVRRARWPRSRPAR